MAYAVPAWNDVGGEPSTFDRLFLDQYERVAAIAFRILGDRDEAEDVAQDVFYSYYRQHAPDAPYAPAWLARAAAHTALNVIRGRQRRSRREETVHAERAAVHDGPADPEQSALEAERRLEVRRALARIGEKQAAVLALRYSGLSYAEVAAALGVNIGQVGTMLRRAEAALRKELIHETH
jgi:RNA polymerase sigma-70 factor (ECF subfamily)